MRSSGSLEGEQLTIRRLIMHKHPDLVPVDPVRGFGNPETLATQFAQEREMLAREIS
jgi:hypothetical protein